MTVPNPGSRKVLKSRSHITTGVSPSGDCRQQFDSSSTEGGAFLVVGASDGLKVEGRWIRTEPTIVAGNHTGSLGCSIELRARFGRESHTGKVLDSAQGKLGDALVQREASELRLGYVRRRAFISQRLGFWTRPFRASRTFTFCREVVIVVEQMENESPTVIFPSQPGEHVTARLLT